MTKYRTVLLLDDPPAEESLLRVHPVIDYGVFALCRKPCAGTNGCMNFGVRETCPPKAPLFDKWCDLTAPVYVVINEFDLAAQAARMQVIHPKWTDKQCRCSRYWQKGARKVLQAKMDAALTRLPGYAGTWCPEGNGVDVTATLERSLGIKLWPVSNIVRQVGLLGKLR